MYNIIINFCLKDEKMKNNRRNIIGLQHLSNINEMNKMLVLLKNQIDNQNKKDIFN